MHNQKIGLISMIMREAAAEAIKLNNKEVKISPADIASNVKNAKSMVEETTPLLEEQQPVSYLAVKPPTNSLSETSAKTFLMLPAEIHLKIFTFLDPVDATCLALTAKPLYAVYRNSSKAIGLRLPVSLFHVRKGLKWGPSGAWRSGNLLGALYQWIGSDLVLNVHISKLVTRERDKEIFDQTFPNGWYSIELRDSVKGQSEEELDETEPVRL